MTPKSNSGQEIVNSHIATRVPLKRTQMSKVQLATQPLTNVLKAKSRHRRQALAVPSSPMRNDLIPKLELVELTLAEVSLPPRNVRRIESSHIMQVAASISSLGFCDPILVDEDGGVLDGAVRVEAARILGLSRIPCIRANHLNASERDRKSVV